MKRTLVTALLSLTMGLMLIHQDAMGQSREDQIVRDSIAVVNEINAIPASGIPRELMREAHAVAVIPNVIKGSFVVGARFGNGVLLMRDDKGSWHAPVFITLTGGNIGWQVGVQSTDVILVFKSAESVSSLMSGKFTLGADAAVAAGPIGRNAAAATDGRLGAEIYSYSRSRGLFAGVALDGSVIQIDQMANAVYYRPASPGGPVIVPEPAQQLTMMIANYASGGAPRQSAGAAAQAQANSVITQPQAGFAQQHSVDEIEHVRDQLARLAPRLYEKLDPAWQQYLALPAAVFYENGHPTTDELNRSLQNFEEVRADTRYAALANLPEFQSTYGLLRHYVTDLSQSTEPLVLPAPPTARVGSR
ncbi:MAG: lipid-binding SYLF domain-containing protein [Planctomycetota bacterium]